MANSRDVQDHRTKPLIPVEYRCWHKECSCSINIYYLEIMTNINVLKNKPPVQVKGLVLTERFYHKEYSCEILKL